MTLRLDAVSVIRGQTTILDQIHTSCRAGNFTALCGPNGAGKSTALSVLAGAVTPCKGRALLDEQELSSLMPDHLARRRAVVAQQALLGFPFQVHEVVRMGRTPHEGLCPPTRDREILDAALETMGLTPLAGRNYLPLSGGERQRVHIARALAQVWDEPPSGHSRWLLLDEPTAALDLKHQIALLKLLKALAKKGWGVVAVLHDLHLVKAHADEVVLFSGGRIHGQGDVASTLEGQQIQRVFELEAPYPL